MTVRRRLVAAGSALAIRPARAATGADDDGTGSNPFATHKLVLQLSDAGDEKQRLILSSANTTLMVYPNTVSIIVVAFGPGIDLLLAGSPHREAVDSLIAQDVEFDICMNTVNTIARNTGHAPVLNPRAKPVPYGVPRLMQLIAHHYVLVRP
jgi:intracellular sulfur oxidation DsrE/DsrF family protein